MPTAFLSIILILAIVGSLLFSVLLLAYQLRDERATAEAQRHLALREATARRLCRVDDLLPVGLDAPSELRSQREGEHLAANAVR